MNFQSGTVGIELAYDFRKWSTQSSNSNLLLSQERCGRGVKIWQETAFATIWEKLYAIKQNMRTTFKWASKPACAQAESYQPIGNEQNENSKFEYGERCRCSNN